MNEDGSAELLLMLALMLVLQLGLWQLTRTLSQQMTASYEAMDPVSPEEKLEMTEFFALGKSWPAPAPRVDFGADDQHERDAEALCYIVSRFGCAAPGKSFRCY
jgi:ABC-type nickel/cobalt efflux system permease component RcnA